MKSLVLAEKPSVAREIARVLGCRQQHKSYIEGSRYVVTWALGHLIELKMPEDYDPKYKQWKMEDLPIIPEKMGLKIIKQTRHQYKAIEQLLKRKDIKDCIIATDAGREGELVARWILEKAYWKKPIKRLWISSHTDRSIKEGFQKLKPGKEYNNLYKSAVCRAEADWLIGLNVSRALTTKYNDPLSAGRVQTPTLYLILEREKEIQQFVPKEYWTITAKIGPISAIWGANGQNRIFSQEKAEQITEKIKGKKAAVIELKRKQKTEPQPLPYDLTELQRDANHRFGFSAKKTLSLLQQLYEHYKLVTYPRTDSRYLTKDMENTMMDRLQAISSAYRDEVRPILGNKGKVMAKRVFNNEKVTDHHGIIPTEEPLHINDLSNDEKKLYDLIVRRFLALFYPPFQYETIEAVFNIEGELFTVKQSATINKGFKKLFQSKEDNQEEYLLSLKKGQQLTVQSAAAEKKLTSPPDRYSEGDVLAQMEKYGLGTPATRAEIIEKLIQTESVERKNGRLFTTAKGKQLIDLVNKDLKSPELTARWEKELEKIAKGKGDPEQFIQQIRKQTKGLISEIKQSEKTYRAHNLTGSKCPECNSFLKERQTKEGRILVCSNMACKFRKRKDPKLSNRRCPQCRKKMEMHEGKAGLYFQCRPCNIVEKAENKKTSVSKREERQLMKKYTKQEQFGTSLGELLKAALKEEK